MHLVKSEQNVRVFVAVRKTMAGVGHLKRIWKDAFRVAGTVQETHEVDVLGDQGGNFLRWNLGHEIFRFAKMILRGAALRMTWLHFFVAGALLRDMDWKNRKAKRIGTGLELCTQLSIIEGSLAELLRF